MAFAPGPAKQHARPARLSAGPRAYKPANEVLANAAFGAIQSHVPTEKFASLVGFNVSLDAAVTNVMKAHCDARVMPHSHDVLEKASVHAGQIQKRAPLDRPAQAVNARRRVKPVVIAVLRTRSSVWTTRHFNNAAVRPICVSITMRLKIAPRVCGATAQMDSVRTHVRRRQNVSSSEKDAFKGASKSASPINLMAAQHGARLDLAVRAKSVMASNWDASTAVFLNVVPAVVGALMMGSRCALMPKAVLHGVLYSVARAVNNAAGMASALTRAKMARLKRVNAVNAASSYEIVSMGNGVCGWHVKRGVPAGLETFKLVEIAASDSVATTASGSLAEMTVSARRERNNPAGSAVSRFATKNVSGTVAAIATKPDETAGNADGNGACRVVTGRMIAKDTPTILAKRVVYLGTAQKTAFAFMKFKPVKRHL